MGLTLAVLISCTHWWPNLILNYSGLLYMISLVDRLLYNVSLHKCVRTVKSSSAMTFDRMAGLCLVWAPVHTHANYLHARMHVNDETVNVCVCTRDWDFAALWSVWWQTVVSLICHEIITRRDKFAESCSSISVCLRSKLSNRTEIKAHIMLAETQTVLV